MAEPVSLDVINRRIGELVREYDAMKRDDPHVLAICQERLSILGLFIEGWKIQRRVSRGGSLVSA